MTWKANHGSGAVMFNAPGSAPDMAFETACMYVANRMLPAVLLNSQVQTNVLAMIARLFAPNTVGLNPPVMIAPFTN